MLSPIHCMASWHPLMQHFCVATPHWASDVHELTQLNAFGDCGKRGHTPLRNWVEVVNCGFVTGTFENIALCMKSAD